VDYRRRGGYAVTLLPTRRWWPNTWYGTVGLEIAAPRAAWMFDRVGYGLQLEYTGLLHRLGATRPYESALGPVGRRELASARDQLVGPGRPQAPPPIARGTCPGISRQFTDAAAALLYGGTAAQPLTPDFRGMLRTRVAPSAL
jgi:hypothetical protein